MKMSKTKLEIDVPAELLFLLHETEASFKEKVKLWTSIKLFEDKAMGGRNEMGPVIANSPPLIALAKIDEIDLLKGVYSQIVVPKAVYEEVAISGKGKKGGVEITRAEWIIKVKYKTEYDVGKWAKMK